MAVAIPLGALLVAVLFEHVGEPIIDAIIADGVGDGLNAIEAAFAAIGLVIAAVFVAAIVVLSLVAPVFVVLPMVGSAVALRVTRAGLIMRSLWLSLAVFVLLGVGIIALAEVVELRYRWWVWLGVVAVAGFLGRFLVEVWEPRRAATRTPGAARRRWMFLVVVWLCLLVVGAVAGTGLFLGVVDS